jgi:hypothetical protein
MKNIHLVGKLIDLTNSPVLHEFKIFNAKDWVVVGSPKWTVTDSSIIGGPEPDTHSGHFGFGIYQSHVEYRKLVVYTPKWQNIEDKY